MRQWLFLNERRAPLFIASSAVDFVVASACSGCGRCSGRWGGGITELNNRTSGGSARPRAVLDIQSVPLWAIGGDFFHLGRPRGETTSGTWRLDISFGRNSYKSGHQPRSLALKSKLGALGWTERHVYFCTRCGAFNLIVLSLKYGAITGGDLVPTQLAAARMYTTIGSPPRGCRVLLPCRGFRWAASAPDIVRSSVAVNSSSRTPLVSVRLVFSQQNANHCSSTGGARGRVHQVQSQYISPLHNPSLINQAMLLLPPKWAFQPKKMNKR
ncbi:unnamed protein product, partial [Laminaria digitata]